MRAICRVKKQGHCTPPSKVETSAPSHLTFPFLMESKTGTLTKRQKRTRLVFQLQPCSLLHLSSMNCRTCINLQIRDQKLKIVEKHAETPNKQVSCVPSWFPQISKCHQSFFLLLSAKFPGYPQSKFSERLHTLCHLIRAGPPSLINIDIIDLGCYRYQLNNLDKLFLRTEIDVTLSHTIRDNICHLTSQ